MSFQTILSVSHMCVDKKIFASMLHVETEERSKEKGSFLTNMETDIT